MDYKDKSKEELIRELLELKEELRSGKWTRNKIQPEIRDNKGSACNTKLVSSEEALRKCEAAFELAQELAHMGSWEQNLITGETYWSRNTYVLFGLEPYSVVPSATYFDSRVKPEDLEQIYLLLSELNETRKKADYQYRMLMPDGSEKWFQSRIEPVFENGTLVSLKGTNLDITDIKRKEDEIVTKNEWMNAIMHATPDLVFVYDLDGFCREYYGNAGDQLAETEKAIIGSNLKEMFGEEESTSILNKARTSVQQNKAINFEIQVEISDGIYHFDVRIAPLGKERVLVLARDITKSKRAMEEIKKLSLAVEQSPLSVVITDLKGTIEYVNPWFSKITGFKAEEVLGQNPRILKSGNHEAEFYKKMWDDLSAGKQWTGSIQNRKKNGELFWESATISPIKNESGETTNFISIKEDITEKVKAEQQLKESLYTRDKLFSIIAHDLRGPIGNFIPMVDILSESDNLDESFRKELLEGMKKTAITTFDLLENLLNWAKFQSKAIRLKPVKFDISDAIHDMAELYTTSAALKSIQFKIETSGQLNVIADKDSVKLVIRNLLNNAIKFTGNNGTITISDRDEGDKVAVEIADNGVGMTAEVLENLFRPNTLHSTYGTDNEKGSGLGLILCKEFVEKNGGTIHVISAPGEGSRFIFTLNKYGTSGKKVKKHVNMIPIDHELLRDRKILLVEDDPFSQLYGKNLLQQWNAIIEVAANGKEAIEKLKTDSFEIILMDTEMPVMDGYSAMQVIREELQLTIPVIAFSANIGGIALDKAAKGGFNDYMNKPGNPIELFSRIIHHLGIKVPEQDSSVSEQNIAGEPVEKYGDTRKLKQALGNDLDLTKEMIAKFLEITPIYYREMLASFEKGDHQQLKQVAHKLKSSIHLLANKNLTENIKLINDYAANPEHKQTLKQSMDFFRLAYPLLCEELKSEL